jgi:hemoglobin
LVTAADAPFADLIVFIEDRPMTDQPSPAEPFTESQIDRLVEDFYAKVRLDPRLGPVFERAMGADGWPAHLAVLKVFWSSVLRRTGQYKGSPMAVHARVPDLTEDLFATWLALFHATCAEVFDAERARQAGAAAERIARSLKLGLFFRPEQFA